MALTPGMALTIGMGRAIGLSDRTGARCARREWGNLAGSSAKTGA